jgi:PadR family transcriptional regulator PadR
MEHLITFSCTILPHIGINTEKHMKIRTDTPSEVDQLVLLSIARLGEDAYGVHIRRLISDHGGREVSMAAVYASLERLETKGMVEGRLSDPSPRRGGRAKKILKVSRDGAAAVQEARQVMDRMWAGLDELEVG